MLKKFLKYERQRVLFCLTIILILAIYVIICDCDLPIVNIHPEIDDYLEKIFVHEHEDKTLYNIAISYVAAYIFYIVQVYVPMVQNNKKGMILLKNEIEKYINNINLLLIILKNIVEQKENEIIIKDKNARLFIVEENSNQIIRITVTISLETLIESIKEQEVSIMTSPAFSYLDNSICEKLNELPIKKMMTLSRNILNQLNSTKTVPIKEGIMVDEIREIIKELQKKYGFEFETYKTTDSEALIGEYYAYSIMMTTYTNNELEMKVRLS